MLQRKKEKRLEKQNAVKALSAVSVALLTLAGTSQHYIKGYNPG